MGHLDRCDGEQIDGWVTDLDDPGHPLRLEVYFGDILLGECVADRHRPDLVSAGIGDGNCAFVFVPPTRLSASMLREIKLRIGDTRQVFRFGRGPPEPETAEPPSDPEDSADALAPAKRFRSCILHIGTEHTDAESLQRFLGLNRRTLGDGGYFVPVSLAPPHASERLNHSHLAAVTMDDGRLDDDLRADAEVHDQDSLERFRKDVLAAFEAEIAAVPEHCRTLILSNEHCHSRLLSTDEVGFVKDFLDQWCEEYAIVVYFRAQHELAMGRYGAMLLRGVTDIDMLPSLPPGEDSSQVTTGRAYFDYHGLIERWSRVFGEAAVHPRLFAPHLLVAGNIIDDFMRDIALPEGELRRPRPAVGNISGAAQKFLLTLYPRLDAEAGPGGPAVIARISAAARARYPGDGIMPARGEVATFLDYFRDSNENLRAHWFPEREELFDVDLLAYPEIPETNDLEPDMLVAFFAGLLLEDQARGSALALSLERIAHEDGVVAFRAGR
jgi:hypothetical protein